MMRGGLAVLLVALLPGVSFAQDVDGAALFEQNCAACHNSGGTGVPGLAPPLDRPEFWQELGDDAPTYLGGIMTKGMLTSITVRGEMYAGIPMPPVAGVEDADLATIAGWVLADLGKTDLAVTPESITTIRESDLTKTDLAEMRPKTQ
ncbi:MAG: c-type cytochrome [Paracoccus sp. (in: a-proteobacteria)]